VVVVGASADGAQRRERPDVANRGQTLVLHLAVVNDQAAAKRSGDGCRTGVGLERASVREAGAVVAELGQDTGAGQFGKAGKLMMISASGCWWNASAAVPATIDDRLIHHRHVNGQGLLLLFIDLAMVSAIIWAVVAVIYAASSAALWE
jgi:hypothetical protein